MSITVHLASQRPLTFDDADDYDTDEHGNLVVFGAGLFHRDEWLAAVRETKPSAPRVWDDIRDIPDGVRVVDKDGDDTTWKGDGYRESFALPCDYGWANRYAPFTEILGGAE